MARSACAATLAEASSPKRARAAARISALLLGRPQHQPYPAGEDHAIAVATHLQPFGVDLAVRPVATDRPLAGHAPGARVDLQVLGNQRVAAIVARGDVAGEIEGVLG